MTEKCLIRVPMPSCSTMCVAGRTLATSCLHSDMNASRWHCGMQAVGRSENASRATIWRIAPLEGNHRISSCAIMLQPTPTSSVYEDLLRMLEGPALPTALIDQGTYIFVSALREVARSGRR